MIIKDNTVDNNLFIELKQLAAKGTPWQVRVYKKVFGFKKRISSDWFLDEGQARRFADQLSKELQSKNLVKEMKQREPGWTLRRPGH